LPRSAQKPLPTGRSARHEHRRPVACWRTEAEQAPRARAAARRVEPDRRHGERGDALRPITAKLLIDDAETAALLGIKPGSVANLESRDPDFPKPIEWALDRKVRRRAEVETYVANLKQRRT
jgi:hypothetical protein